MRRQPDDGTVERAAPNRETLVGGAGPAPAGVEAVPTDIEGVEVAPSRRLGLSGWAALIWMGLVVLAAIVAPLLPVDDPNQSFPGLARQGPTGAHWFGGDAIGRDVFARVIWGARASLIVSISAVLIGLIIGGVLGLIAGYYRGRTETLLVGLFDILLAFPQLVLALALVAVYATGENVTSTRRMVVLIIALGIVSIPILARITRANTLVWSQREFVTAARAMGASDLRILWREVLPNVLPAMASIALLGVAVVIVAEGGLSVLGVGVQLPTPSWGNMIAEGRSVLRDSPWPVFVPSGAIFLTVLALNYLGDVIRARFDVRESML